jgi:hypothetical protein
MNNNNNDKKINLTLKTEKNQNRESAEIQQINAVSELNPNKTFIRKMQNDDRNSPKKIFTNKPPNQQHIQAQSTLLNKSISPRIQKTVTSLLNSSSGNQQHKNKPNINRSSKSPIKNHRRKIADNNYERDEEIDKENEQEYFEDEDEDMMNTTNYDKDDSLLDVESIGKQTPFRIDSVDASFSVFGANLKGKISLLRTTRFS